MIIKPDLRKKIIRELRGHDVKLPEGALLYEIDGQPMVAVRDTDLAARIYAKGGLAQAKLHLEEPPLSLVEPWGLPDEPRTRVAEDLVGVEGVARVETGFGASTCYVVANVFLKPGIDPYGQTGDTLQRVVRQIEKACSGVQILLYPIPHRG